MLITQYSDTQEAKNADEEAMTSSYCDASTKELEVGVSYFVYILLIMSCSSWISGNVPFAHVAIDHSHSPQPVPRLSIIQALWVVDSQLQREQTVATRISKCTFSKLYII